MDTQTPKNSLSQQDQALLDQAGYLMELVQGKAYQMYLKPFLVDLAAEGWPKPQEYQDKPQPQEALILAYTRKVGEADAIKKIVEYLETQNQVADRIKQKEADKDAYKIGQS